MTLLDCSPGEIFCVLCFVHYSVLKKYEINSGQHREMDYAGIRAESQEENIFKIQKPLHTISLFYAVPILQSKWLLRTLFRKNILFGIKLASTPPHSGA